MLAGSSREWWDPMKINRKKKKSYQIWHESEMRLPNQAMREE